MILGTHNSGTCYNLVWWQRPIAWPLHITSRCQKKTILEQLLDGVRVFNFQITKYRGEWVFSHGLCIYDSKVLDNIELFKLFESDEDPIYFNMYLDKNFIMGQDVEGFKEFVIDVLKSIEGHNITLLYTWIEGTDEFPYESDTDIDIVEHYWSMAWGTQSGKWYNKIPLPKRHAKKYNKKYIENNTHDYLMLDFYEYQ